MCLLDSCPSAYRQEALEEIPEAEKFFLSCSSCLFILECCLSLGFTPSMNDMENSSQYSTQKQALSLIRGDLEVDDDHFSLSTFCFEQESF